MQLNGSKFTTRDSNDQGSDYNCALNNYGPKVSGYSYSGTMIGLLYISNICTNVPLQSTLMAIIML